MKEMPKSRSGSSNTEEEITIEAESLCYYLDPKLFENDLDSHKANYSTDPWSGSVLNSQEQGLLSEGPSRRSSAFVIFESP